MIRHLFKYNFKTNLLSRDGLLFSIFMPFVLGLIFLFAFEGLLTGGIMEEANVAVEIEGNDEERETVIDFLESVGVEGELDNGELQPLEKITDDDYIVYYLSNEKVEEMLDEGALNAKIWIDNRDNKMDIKIHVPANMANQMTSYLTYSIFNSYASIYDTNYENMGRLQVQAYEGRDLSFIDDIIQRNENELEREDFIYKKSKEGINSYTHYFMVTLAFVAIYFIRVGVDIVRNNEGYMGAKGKRLAISPVPKLKRVFASFLALSIPSLLVVYTLLMVYWQRDIGLSTDYPYVILVMTLGTLICIFMGTAIASLFKLSEDKTQAIIALIPILSSLLGGLMGQGSFILKAWLAENASIVNIINPVALITDVLYQLSFYPTYDQVHRTIATMFLYLTVLILLTIFGLRRVK